VTISRRLACLILVALLWPAGASAQQAVDNNPPAWERGPWIVVGGGWTTLLGDCTDCEDRPYIKAGSVVGDGGVAINRRIDVGGEVFWTGQTLSTGDRIHVTTLMGAVQFRPWVTQGFFVKGGIGLAILRNWLDTTGSGFPPERSRAMAVGIGAGWEFPIAGRFGVQILGSQHVTALGDLRTSERTIENVMGNFWSAGAAVVIR
jgi:hypothetical protein